MLARPLRALLSLLLAVVFVSELAAPAVAKKHRAPAAKPTATEATKPAQTVKAPKEALLAAADEIAKQVSALRGLTLEKPLARGVLSRDQIGAKLKARIGKEYTPEEVRGEGQVLKRIGLLPKDADYEKMILDLLMEQVAGFYDPFTAKLYIADWLPLEMQRPAMAHEIEHALQDQHFDLKRFAEPIKDDGDLQLARSALVEGDGTAVMLEFQAQSMGMPVDAVADMVGQIGKQMVQGGMGQAPLFEKSPPFLKETLIFPYLSGLTFVEALHKQAPWSKIDDAFRSPPESTEQVMHPEKYLAHEHPLKVTDAPVAALAPEKALRRDVLGELEFRILFASQLSDDKAEKAAAGWGGDRLVAYDVAGAAADALPTVIDLSAWDSETDAKEAEAAGVVLLAKLAEKPAAKPGAPALYTDSAHAEWWVERRGNELLLIFGAPAGSHAAAADQIWKSWKVSAAAPASKPAQPTR
jgi:hypothetical protein